MAAGVEGMTSSNVDPTLPAIHQVTRTRISKTCSTKPAIRRIGRRTKAMQSATKVVNTNRTSSGRSPPKAAEVFLHPRIEQPRREERAGAKGTSGEGIRSTTEVMTRGVKGMTTRHHKKCIKSPRLHGRKAPFSITCEKKPAPTTTRPTFSDQASSPSAICAQTHTPPHTSSTSSSQPPPPPPPPPSAALALLYTTLPPTHHPLPATMSIRGTFYTTTPLTHHPFHATMSAQPTTHTIETIPTEILMNILKRVPAHSHLATKLVSKLLHTYAITANPTIHLSKARLIHCHTKLEASIPRGRPLVCCICTVCGRVKDTNHFSDNQAKKANPMRICIACGIAAKIYTKRKMPKVGGEARVPCWNCREAVPVWRDWRYCLSDARDWLIGDPSLTPSDVYVVGYCRACLAGKLGFWG